MKYTNELQFAEFDEQGLSTVAGWATVYRANSVTREYIGKDLVRVPYRGSVAADAYLDEPELPATEEIAIIRSYDEKSWRHVPDYRGKMAYHTQTKEPQQVRHPGALLPELTLLEPDTPFDEWKGQRWVTDIAAQHAHEMHLAENQRNALLHDAEQHIVMLKRKIKLEMATETETALLREWEVYSIQLVDIDCSTAPVIHWPEQPK
ncbi:tail fiber assembly protein [Xenorhabdus sp. KJ12.1]|uniref:tail fiber assembly protein n=1 Tax=Xenorhabdus sp. KJ12.1 TaxID=1851571 RepID=UPI000C052702|nr:tail fiber assembly protein [Xenorhabdus sp. KJ12.1]PHM68258.1 tail fiber protein of a prophage [Xenorhabdus sp. KJ12.1]